jgi:hypothetical protein
VIVGLALAPAATAGELRGRVSFTGEPPARSPVAFGGEKQCALMHGDAPPLVEDVVVGLNGGLRDVLVYLTGEAPGGPHTPPAEPLVYEQHGCLFKPHVGAVMVGQPIEVRNDDPVLHNVRAQSKLGQSFNIAQPMQGMKTTKKMKAQEIGIPLKCDVHFWMTGYLHSLAHPFFAMTGEDGAFAIANLPPGTYTFEAWHPALGTRIATATITDGEPAALTFAFSPKP